MASPSQADWGRLKKLGRYLKGKPRLVWRFGWQEQPDELTTYSDSDWAGDKSSRKCTSGGVIKYGEHVLQTWAKGQSIIALSTAEAEMYALIKATSEALGQMSLYKEWNLVLSGKMYSDASAAL